MNFPVCSRLILLLILFLTVISGCAPSADFSEEYIAIGLTQTQVAKNLMNQPGTANQPVVGEPEAQQAPAATNTNTPTSTITLSPTITLTATITLTPTLDKPMISVSENTNCRSGPGKDYDYLGALLVNEQAEVVGQSMDGQYWIIKNPDQAGECWLWGYYASVQGPIEGLAKYTPPPSPTPEFTWDGTWTTYSGQPGGPFFAYTMTITVNDNNFSAVENASGTITNLSGTISQDKLSVSGTWSNNIASGNFTFYALGADQFQGNGVDLISFAWCGSQGGAGMPSPCFKQ